MRRSSSWTASTRSSTRPGGRRLSTTSTASATSIPPRRSSSRRGSSATSPSGFGTPSSGTSCSRISSPSRSRRSSVIGTSRPSPTPPTVPSNAIGWHRPSRSRAIAELAGNPLLLTMMAILNRNQELPRDRAELYQQAARVLLHQWDTERALESDPELKGTIGYKEKAEILRRVAWFMQSGRSGLAGNIIASEDLEALLQDYLKGTLSVSQPLGVARALVEQLRQRNFILCYLGGDSYAFVHRTFLEFFCASKIVRQFQREQSLSFEGLRDEIFGTHWADETWHEVLCLIAGMIDARFVEQLIAFLIARPAQDDHKYHHVFLAAQCFHEVRNPAFLAAVREP